MSDLTMITRAVPGLDEAVRSRLVIGLNRNLASLSDLATAYKQAHWHVVGSNFARGFDRAGAHLGEGDVQHKGRKANILTRVRGAIRPRRRRS